MCLGVPLVLTFEVCTTSTKPFVVSVLSWSLLLDISLKLEDIAIRRRVFSSLLFIYRFPLLVLTRLRRPVFPHHLLRTKLPWSFPGKLSYNQQVRRTAMEYPLIVSSDI